MITWGDVIDIITSTFYINQTELGNRVGYDKSTISRIRRGATLPPFGNEQLFSAVFDCGDSNSPEKKEKESNYWLGVLKDVIESRFKEVYDSLSDCWDEKNYKTFVLTLLRRARIGAPTEKAPQPPTDCEKSSTSSDINVDVDCLRKQEKVSLGETPFEQMSKIFEQTVANYNIATYICKLPDYLSGESFYAGDAFAFIDEIQTNILSKFVNCQDDNIFKKISEFTLALKAYCGFLGMIRLSVSEKYGIMLKVYGFDNEIISLIDSDCDEVKQTLDREREATGPLTSELEGRINQLEFLHSVFLSHKQLCELFREVCPGKTILVFQ